MCGLGAAACGAAAASAPPPPPASLGNATSLTVPAAVSSLPLVDQNGRPTTLASFRGRVLVLAQFLTSCQEECPLTAGAFVTIQHDLQAAGLAGKVTLAELTIDPDRDTPARLAAYQAYTGVDWTLLTASPDVLATFWHQFGIYYQKVAEGSPPGIDWQTGKPYTYDVDHSNGFLIFDASGRQRFVTIDLPNLHGQIGPQLRRLLDPQGVAALDQADPNQSWTVPQALQAIGWVLGRTVPAAG